MQVGPLVWRRHHSPAVLEPSGREGLRRRLYSCDDVDAFAAYSPDTGRCYYLDAAEYAERTQVLLRLNATKNNQAAGINWARDFEFAATLNGTLGP